MARHSDRLHRMAGIHMRTRQCRRVILSLSLLGFVCIAQGEDHRVHVQAFVAVPANDGVKLVACGNDVVFAHVWSRAAEDHERYPESPCPGLHDLWFEDREVGETGHVWRVRMRKSAQEILAVDWETKRLYLTEDQEKATVWTVRWHNGDGLVPTVEQGGETYVIGLDLDSKRRYENPRICTYNAIVTQDDGENGLVFYQVAK